MLGTTEKQEFLKHCGLMTIWVYHSLVPLLD